MRDKSKESGSLTRKTIELSTGELALLRSACYSQACKFNRFARLCAESGDDDAYERYVLGEQVMMEFVEFLKF